MCCNANPDDPDAVFNPWDVKIMEHENKYYALVALAGNIDRQNFITNHGIGNFFNTPLLNGAGFQVIDITDEKIRKVSRRFIFNYESGSFNLVTSRQVLSIEDRDIFKFILFCIKYPLEFFRFCFGVSFYRGLKLR